MERPSFFRLAGRSPPLLVGAIFLVASAFVFRAAFDDWLRGRRLREEGLEARATIVSLSIDPARRDGNRRTRYLVTHRFATANGEMVERTEEVGAQEWERLEEGETTTLTYLPSDPSNARAAAPLAWWTPLVVAGAAGLALLLGAGLTIPGLRRIRRVFRLYREGEAAEGDVVEVSATRVVVNRVRQWRVRYRFSDRMGNVHVGESDLLAPGEALRFRAGDRGAVRYDPLRPEENIWVGSPGEEAQAQAAARGSPLSPPTPMPARKKLPAPLRLLINIAVALGAVFVAAVIAELPPVKELVSIIARHREALLWPVVSVLSLGFLLFLGSILGLLMERGEPMSRADIEDPSLPGPLAARPSVRSVSIRRFRGKAVGREARDEFTFRELKDAWRSGRVVRDPRWRRRLLIVIGGLAMSLGLLSLFVVLGPPWLKVLVGGAMAYVVVRIAWGVWKA